MGIFWPDRNLTEQPLEDSELKCLCSKQEQHGVSQWGTFTALRGSSTRCELATAIMVMLRGGTVHIGTDSLALVKKGTAYLEHLKARRDTRLKESDGALILGGKTSHLHRGTPWRQKWKLMKDGDLWHIFGVSAEAKSPEAVRLTKVKGHATKQMVIHKEVRADDRFGNDRSDQAAEKGVANEQPKLSRLAKFYAGKQKDYKQLMQKIQKFIVATKKADKDLRGRMKKEEDPFENKENLKVKVAKKLQYANDMEQTFQCTMRYARREECTSDAEHRTLKGIVNFISNITWQKEYMEGG